MFLSGCATIHIHHPLNKINQTSFTLDYCVQSTAEMNTVDKTLSNRQNRDQFKNNISAAIIDIEQHLHSNGIESPVIQTAASSDCEEHPVNGPFKADLYLVIQLSGYGSIKKKWKHVLIGTGVGEGVAEGIAVKAATQNPWLAIGVAAEEILQEYLTWNGVDWLLGETFAPVTLEGRLIYLKTGKIIWRDSYFVTHNKKELTDKDKNDKAKQLRASLHKAETELMSSLNRYISKEIEKPLAYFL